MAVYFNTTNNNNNKPTINKFKLQLNIGKYLNYKNYIKQKEKTHKNTSTKKKKYNYDTLSCFGDFFKARLAHINLISSCASQFIVFISFLSLEM